mgnify:CR=1 FL=1
MEPEELEELEELEESEELDLELDDLELEESSLEEEPDELEDLELDESELEDLELEDLELEESELEELPLDEELEDELDLAMAEPARIAVVKKSAEVNFICNLCSRFSLSPDSFIGPILNMPLLAHCAVYALALANLIGLSVYLLGTLPD